MVLKDKTGKQCSAVEVFTLSIKYLVDHLMTEKEKGGVVLNDHAQCINAMGRGDEILWVLTVPAAWTDSGKQLMRESAEKVLLSNTYLHHSATKFQTH
jgi:hypothetical protein